MHCYKQIITCEKQYINFAENKAYLHININVYSNTRIKHL